jgi:hypothetical protein
VPDDDITTALRFQETRVMRAEEATAVFLLLYKRRCRCLRCRKVFTERHPVSGPRRLGNHRLRRHLS